MPPSDISAAGVVVAVLWPESAEEGEGKEGGSELPGKRMTPERPLDRSCAKKNK